MKIYLGKDAQGEYVKMSWSGSLLELNELYPDIVWYSTLDSFDDFDHQEDIKAKAEKLGITTELYMALRALGKN